VEYRPAEKFDGGRDLERFDRAVIRDGVEEAAKLIIEREAAPGTRFAYASAETEVLGAVLRGATGTSVSEYLTGAFMASDRKTSRFVLPFFRNSLERPFSILRLAKSWGNG
jgi:hypothetical protein